MAFQQKLEEWLHKNIVEERNPRRREMLNKGLGHGTIEFLSRVWYPTFQHFDYLYPEWEVKDMNNTFRYLDLAYMPKGALGAIEIQGYGPHARDVSVTRFKDLCMRQSLLALEGWIVLTVAYPSIIEDTEQCKKLALAFVGKFVAMPISVPLHWLEAETIRFARRLVRPFTPQELADHLQITVQYARRVLRQLIHRELLVVASGNQRYRTYQLP